MRVSTLFFSDQLLWGTNLPVNPPKVIPLPDRSQYRQLRLEDCGFVFPRFCEQVQIAADRGRQLNLEDVGFIRRARARLV